MPKFAANISMMFTEHVFLDRFEAAARAGFAGVEYLFPYEWAAGDLADRLRTNRLEQALFNTWPGNWESGQRGLAAVPGREEEFERAVIQALDYADELGNSCIHAMSGLVPDGGDRNAHRATLVANLRRTAPLAAARGKTLIIEPINTRDIPGYFLNYQAQARGIIEEVGADNVRLQFDLYHCQIMEGDLAVHMRDYIDIIAHMQIAGNPGRHEPDTGEVNYAFLFEEMDRLGYDGWVGCEYRPRGETVAGLGWFREA